MTHALSCPAELQSKDAAFSPCIKSAVRIIRQTVLTLPFIGLSAMAASTVEAQDIPKLGTNQAYVETVTRQTKLDIDDIMSVFSFVFNSLPGQVKVYPTENYYYFSFTHQGLDYVGNLRLDISDRDKGVVHFAYFRKYTEWNRGEDPNYRLLGKADGVIVAKKDKLSYKISYKGKTVQFNFVDLSNVRPPKRILAPNERYIGPVYDESGIQFYLVFNDELKIFHYILNEQVPVGEQVYTSIMTDRIVVGLRTGFAYYKDKYYDRKILIGVHEYNSHVNNYFDGPFDQLPDNFIKGDELYTAILAVQPDSKGKIDRLGNSPDGATRFYIGPYMHYSDETELAIFDECAEDPKMIKEEYHACFVVEPEEEEYDDEEVVSYNDEDAAEPTSGKVTQEKSGTN